MSIQVATQADAAKASGSSDLLVWSWSLQTVRQLCAMGHVGFVSASSGLKLELASGSPAMLLSKSFGLKLEFANGVYHVGFFTVSVLLLSSSSGLNANGLPAVLISVLSAVVVLLEAGQLAMAKFQKLRPKL